MRIFLEIINGRYAGTTLALESGEVCTVGGTFGADLFLPNDSQLAPLHFVVKNEAEKCVLETLAGEEVFVNNQLFSKSEPTHGDFILAGETLFQMTANGEKTSDETVLGKLLERLLKIENLFLLIDENADRRILPLLNEYEAEFEELKKDVKDFEMMTANPILVAINGNRKLLENLLRSFWGTGFLVFFKSKNNRMEMIEKLQLLLAKTQMTGGADLRFYDARILRVALGEAEPQHAQYFFGAAEKYFVESQLPSHLFEFTWENGKLKADLIKLSDDEIK